MSEPQSPYHPALEVTITLPLDVVESVVGTARRFHPGSLKPRDREYLDIAEKEVEEVKKLIGK